MSTTQQPRPEFLGIGAGKAGTSWLWSMLRQHPNIFLPTTKELHQFNEESPEDPSIPNPRFNRPLNKYLAFFADARSDQICGEITPAYLWSETAPASIRHFDPQMKLLAIIRDPVARSFSHYMFRRQNGVGRNESFEEAIEREPFLLERSMYHRHLSHFLEFFPLEQICVVRYDDLNSNPDRLLGTVFRFLELPPFIPADVAAVRNQTGTARRPRLARTFTRGRLYLRSHGMESVLTAARSAGVAKVVRRLTAETIPYESRPTVAPDTERILRDMFRPDIEATEDLVGLDLSSWKRPPS